MHLYIRYFNNEVLVSSIEEALEFLYSIQDLGMTKELENDIRNYYNSDVYYPKRYKIRPKAYFILIKTRAENMEDFKAKKALNTPQKQAQKKEHAPHTANLAQNNPGWYEAKMDFKRVMMIPGTGKFEYRDTHVEYRLKADSVNDCYARVINHVKERVDSRSQFPSVKGKNFHCKYLGMWK